MRRVDHCPEGEYQALRRALCKRGRHIWGRGQHGRKCCYCDAEMFPLEEDENADA